MFAAYRIVRQKGLSPRRASKLSFLVLLSEPMSAQNHSLSVSGSADFIGTHGRLQAQEHRLRLKRPTPHLGVKVSRHALSGGESSARGATSAGMGSDLKWNRTRSNWDCWAPRVCPNPRAHSMPSSLRGCLCHPL